ncbi:hypothetical protein NDU88_001035 [Pleurodeles waltl]|uniref:Uncharacterized protein n=1 Tax=Pleurodeles waltl TaxID=8319 RepID=A0AAV7P482_PLEWA|nr:hypothetical protein NDU88_001035 [Pleurodeles waltl]
MSELPGLSGRGPAEGVSLRRPVPGWAWPRRSALRSFPHLQLSAGSGGSERVPGGGREPGARLDRRCCERAGAQSPLSPVEVRGVVPAKSPAEIRNHSRAVPAGGGTTVGTE